MNKFLKEKVSRVCVHLFCRESSKINNKKMMHSGVNNGIALFCRESSKINNKKMMHSGVNNGIAGSPFFRLDLVGLSTFLHNLYMRHGLVGLSTFLHNLFVGRFNRIALFFI
jgi:hypothetical protein